MTIVEAVIQVMMATGTPMTPKEATSEIIRSNLYAFKTKDPVGVVRGQMRNHTIGYHKASAAKTSYFQALSGDKYLLSTKPL